VDKNGALDVLYGLARAHRADRDGDTADLIHSVTAWLEQTETVGEVRSALERLEERTGEDASIGIFPESVRDQIFWGDKDRPRTNQSFIEQIDSIRPEPSAEPPDPSEVEPGMVAPLKNGNWANIWRESKFSRFIGIATDVFGEGIHFRWNNQGKALSAGFSLKTEDWDIDWQAWRKKKFNAGTP